MTHKIPSIKVFISSPGDVKAERELVLTTLENLEYRPFLRNKLDIKPVAWDKLMAGTPLSAKLKPQEAINKGLPIPSQCDIVVVIFWSRMGTPFVAEDGTEYLSGTHWELMDALSNAPHDRVLIYRRMSNPDSLSNANDPKFYENVEQYKKLQNFFSSDLFYNSSGQIQRGVGAYNTLEEFRTLIERDLETYAIQILDEIAAKEAAEAAAIATPSTPATPTPSTPSITPKTHDLLLVSAPQDRDLTAGIMAVTQSLGLKVTTLDTALRPADAAQLVENSAALAFLLTPAAKYAPRLTSILSNKRNTGVDLPWLPVLCAGDLQTSIPYGLMSLPQPIVDLRDIKNNPYEPLGNLIAQIRALLNRYGWGANLKAQDALGDMAWVDALNLETFNSQAAQPIEADRPDVYLSYRSTDKQYVYPVLHGLRRVGLKVWCDIDSREGDDWRSEIETAIEQCKLMVALVSENTLPTSWAMEDLAYSDAWEKRIIPLGLDRTFYRADSPYPLRQYDIIDWFPDAGPIEHAGNFKRLLDRIKRYV